MSPRRLETKYATCVSCPGEVVGLEKVSEQYVSGRGYISGNGAVSGYYNGSYGALSGYSRLVGESETWTEYHHETRFFIRGLDGIDQPVRVVGEYIPVLNQHRVTAVYVQGDGTSPLLCALANHNSQQLFCTATRGQIVKHLRIPKYVEERRTLLTAGERRQQLREFLDTYGWMKPWLLLGAGALFILAVVGGVLSGRDAALGPPLLGVCGPAAVLAAALWVWIAYRERQIASQPTHVLEEVHNPEIDDELEAIFRFINEVASAPPPTTQVRVARRADNRLGS